MNSHLRFYNMKRLFITLWVLIACLSISAQNKFPSQKELQEECKKILNGLNVLNANLDSIHNAQMMRLSELRDTNYDIDSLKLSNKQVFDGIKEVLILIPQVYVKDTTNNIALVQFDVLVGTYNDYCKAVSISNSGITISDNFRDVIKNANKKISEIKENLGEKEIIEQPQEEDNPNSRSTLYNIKDIPLEVWLILALNAILVVFGVILIISHNKMHQRLERHSRAIKEFGGSNDLSNIETQINNLKKDIDNLRYYGTIKNTNKNSNSNHSTVGLYDLNKLKTDLLGEIDKIKADLERLKSSNTPSYIGTTNPNLTEQTKTSDLSNDQSHPQILKGMFAQLQGNGSFKTYDSDRPNAFYIIKPQSASGTIGEFSLKDLTPESSKVAIDDRNSLLVAACEIVETSANPKKIKVESFGTAEKRGNEWYVKDKAKISLID